MNLLNYGSTQLPNFVILLVFAWTLFWKGVALWRAAKEAQKNWFIAILVLNGLTLGILEIIYLFGFAKKKLALEELKSWIKFK